MTIFQLIRLLLANQDVVLELIKLFQELFKGGQVVVAMSDETASAMGEFYPALWKASGGDARPSSFLDLIKLIIENKEDLKELIKFIMELINSFKGDPAVFVQNLESSGQSGSTQVIG